MPFAEDQGIPRVLFGGPLPERLPPGIIDDELEEGSLILGGGEFLPGDPFGAAVAIEVDAQTSRGLGGRIHRQGGKDNHIQPCEQCEGIFPVHRGIKRNRSGPALRILAKSKPGAGGADLSGTPET
jgi:hypothetical protein